MKKLLFISLLLTVCTHTAFCSTGYLGDFSHENNKTIKELKENINVLNKDKRYLNIEFSVLNKDLKLRSFFREDFTYFEIKSIKYIINNYIASKDRLEAAIIEKAKNLSDTSDEKILLLESKKKFYKSLVPFIKKDKMRDYLDYITLDAKILKEKKDVDTKLITKKEIINQKVEKIEKKIIEHKQNLDHKFQTLTEQRVEDKIHMMKSNEKFANLSFDLKIKVLNRIIDKVNMKISFLGTNTDQTDALSRKKHVYVILLKKLEIFKESLY